jgi:hypothetical protein
MHTLLCYSYRIHKVVGIEMLLGEAYLISSNVCGSQLALKGVLRLKQDIKSFRLSEARDSVYLQQARL